MTVCHGNMEWVTAHLLDSTTLGGDRGNTGDGESDDEEENDNDKTPSSSLTATSTLSSTVTSSSSPLLSQSTSSKEVKARAPQTLASLCMRQVKLTSKTDSDSLEMNVIQAAQSRLNVIENFNLARLLSMSESSERPTSDIIDEMSSQDSFKGTVSPVECWDWISKPSFETSPTRRRRHQCHDLPIPTQPTDSSFPF